MTEQPAAPPAGKPPAPPQDSPQDRVEKLRAQLAEAVAAIPPPPGTVRLRVTGPHDSFAYGGFAVGAVPVPVPAGAVPGLMSAAADAGVTLEEA